MTRWLFNGSKERKAAKLSSETQLRVFVFIICLIIIFTDSIKQPLDSRN